VPLSRVKIGGWHRLLIVGSVLWLAVWALFAIGSAPDFSRQTREPVAKDPVPALLGGVGLTEPPTDGQIEVLSNGTVAKWDAKDGAWYEVLQKETLTLEAKSAQPQKEIAPSSQLAPKKEFDSTDPVAGGSVVPQLTEHPTIGQTYKRLDGITVVWKGVGWYEVPLAAQKRPRVISTDPYFGLKVQARQREQAPAPRSIVLYAVQAFGIGMAPPLFVYVFGWSIAWIVRGFRS